MKFELFLKIMQCSKYSIWGKGLSHVKIGLDVLSEVLKMDRISISKKSSNCDERLIAML